MSKRVLLVAVTAIAVVASGWLVTAWPAHADERGTAGTSVTGVRHGFVTGRTRYMATHSDEFWAGYAADGKTYTSVSGSWVVPSITCSKTQDSSTSPWVGIDGWNSPTVEQIGMDQNCNHGKLSFAPWVEMYPADSIYFTETVKPGDAITASVTYQGSNRFALVESDATQGWSKTYHLSAKAQRNSAEAILEDLGNGIQPVAKFTALRFTGLTANGAPLAKAGKLHATDLTRGSTRLTNESQLTSGAFTITWLHT
jgi:hypothetical protein